MLLIPLRNWNGGGGGGGQILHKNRKFAEFGPRTNFCKTILSSSKRN